MKKYRSTSVGKSPSRNRLKVLGVAILIVAVIVGGLAGLDAANKIDIPGFKDKKIEATEPNNTVNYNPPTDEEKQETEEFKKDHVTSDESATQPVQTPGTKKSVVPVISSWGQNRQTGDVEVGGFVPSIFEDGGQCTLTLTKADKNASKSSASTKSAQNVSCGVIVIPKAELTSGTWKIKLDYNSSTAAGSSSQSVEVEVN